MRVLVTGGSGAIGSAIVRELCADYNVTFTYHNNKSAAEKLAAETDTVAVHCDVANRESILKLTLEHTPFGILINNAGIAQYKLFQDITIDEWNRMLSVNLTGAFNMTQAVLPAMLNRKSGVIVNVSSVWGEVGASCEVAYSAAKAGLIGMTKALAKELEPSGIYVRYIAPEAVESPMNAGFSEIDLLGACPTGRVQTPEDVAKEIKQLLII